jgi:hypothetical protein
LSFGTHDPSTSMAVTWSSDSAAAQVVQFGVGSTAEREVAATVSPQLGGGLAYVHSATLDGLLPDTAYRYRVGSAADGYSPASGSFDFSTGPADPCAPYSFVALGDTRGTSYLSFIGNATSTWVNVFDALAAENPAFALIAGDLVEHGDELEEWQEFFNQGTHHYARLPVMPSFGNHDDGGSGVDPYEHLFTLPPNSAGNEKYHYFQYANVIVLAFNSEEDTLFTEQQQYFDEVLAQHPATWRVMYFHHPVWTTTPGKTILGCSVLPCGHPPDEKGQNALLVDLIDRYSIDVVIQSHNHFYERSVPMRGGGSAETQIRPATTWRGTNTNPGSWGSLFVVTGGGGATPIPVSRLNDYLGSSQIIVEGRAAVGDDYHYLRFTVQDTSLTMQAVRTDGSIMDAVTINKLAAHRVGTCVTPLPGDSGPVPGDPDVPGDSAPAGGDSATDSGTPDGGDRADKLGSLDGCECSGGSAAGALSAILAMALVKRRRERR